MPTISGVMETTRHPLSPPSLQELAQKLAPALEENYQSSTIAVEPCPDLRQAPFDLAAEGLSGNEVVADIGGQPHLFPRPLLDKKYSLLECAQRMEMAASQGHLLGAGAGPFHVLGKNTELAPNLSWSDGFDNVQNLTKFAGVAGTTAAGRPRPECRLCPSTDCALMMNLYGSEGRTGPVLRITARARRGHGKSLPEFLRSVISEAYGERQVTVGGVFLIKSGTALFHIMPDFPPSDRLPFKDRHVLNHWLTYHHFAAPIVCLTVFHSADPEKLGLRMEHTHCFSSDGKDEGGHYHYDLRPGDEGSDGDEIEYEAYLNTAKTLYRLDRAEATVAQDSQN